MNHEAYGRANHLKDRESINVKRTSGQMDSDWVLERSYPPPPPSGGSVGVGVAGGSGGWGGTGGAIGITLPLGSLAPALVSSASLADAATGRLVWTGRARGSGAANEAAQVGELTRLTAEALKGSGLF